MFASATQGAIKITKVVQTYCNEYCNISNILLYTNNLTLQSHA